MSHPPIGLMLGTNEGFAGTRYGLLHTPPSHVPAVGSMVYLPPMGEEMNRSRRMAALMARKLAQAGWTILQLDLHGCGDSAGEQEQTSWDAWLDDAVAAHQWLEKTSGHFPWFWGARHGALLAQAAAPQLRSPIRLLLWQPVVDGATALRQMLRSGADTGLSANDRMTALAAGNPVHVPGQVITPSVAQGLLSSRLNGPGSNVRSIAWFDVTPDGQTLPGRDSATISADLGRQLQVRHQTVRGPSFWISAATEEAPELLDATLAAIASHELDAGVALQSSWQSSVNQCLPARVELQHEVPIGIAAGSDVLQGIVSRPDGGARLGLIIVVGGPQVRTGAHRLFTQLARHAADAGFASLRFDLRGMGDSTGQPTPFDKNGEELSAAISALIEHCPSVERVVLLGLCDGASSALLYTGQADSRVAGLLLLNPWAHSPHLAAHARLRHHYPRRFFEKDFWQKLIRGRINWQSLSSMWQDWRATKEITPPPEFLRRMESCWIGFAGTVRVVLSDNDFTAREFERAHADWTANAAQPKGLRNLATMTDADHTFSDPAVRQRVAVQMESFLAELAARDAGDASHG